MISESLVIEWKTDVDDRSETKYFLNKKSMGTGDIGFDHILEMIKKNPASKVILKIDGLHGLGGEDLIESLPFAKRYDQLASAVSTEIEFQFG